MIAPPQALTRPRPRLYRVSEAAQDLALSRSKVYQEIARGNLRAVKIGGSTRVSSDELDRYVAALAQ